MVRKTVLSLSAGQIDSGLSSVATFVAGIYAVSNFGTTLLGAYVVVFTAWNLGRTIPSELVYTPSEVVAVARTAAVRIWVLTSSLRRGALVSFAAALGVIATAFIVQDDVGESNAWALALTAGAVTVIAPLMDHWRKMFHIAQSSWRGAVTATIQMGATLAAVIVLPGGVDPAWIPFGSIAAGYAVSGVVAGLLTAPMMRRRRGPTSDPAWEELSHIGRWLLVANLAVFGSDFILAVVVRAALGSDFLGYAEGARVVARPVVILGVGLAAVLGPRSVLAGMGADPASAKTTRHLFWVISLVGGLIYLPLVGWDWANNPLPALLPPAYAVDGLIAVAVVGAIIFNFGIPLSFELLGARRQRDVARTEIVGSILKMATGLLAPVLQAFTLPVGWGIAFLARGIGLEHYARKIFTGTLAEPPTDPAPAQPGHPGDG